MLRIDSTGKVLALIVVLTTGAGAASYLADRLSSPRVTPDNAGLDENAESLVEACERRIELYILRRAEHGADMRYFGVTRTDVGRGGVDPSPFLVFVGTARYSIDGQRTESEFTCHDRGDEPRGVFSSGPLSGNEF